MKFKSIRNYMTGMLAVSLAVSMTTVMADTLTENENAPLENEETMQEDFCEECAFNAANVTEDDMEGVEEVVGDELVLCSEGNLYSPNLTATQQAIVNRAEEQYQLLWVAQENLEGWNSPEDSLYTFRKGKAYLGVPYGQPVSVGKWVGYQVTNKVFVTVANTAGSYMYTRTGSYVSYTFPYYSNDCSTYVSYCWGLKNRYTTTELPYFAVQQSTGVNHLRVGDALIKRGSHTILIDGLSYDENGTLQVITVLEQTPPKTKRTFYSGASGISNFVNKYLYNGYGIYRLQSVINELASFSGGYTLENDKEMMFNDIETTEWYYTYVEYAFGYNIMKGTDANTFLPMDFLTRGQMAQIIYNLNSRPAVSYSGRFADVAQGIWYEPAVSWCGQNGVVKGYDNGCYGPEDDITREQMAIMLYRYARYKGYDTGNRADYTGYIDEDLVDDWAAEEMSWAVAEGIICGKEDQTMLDPLGSTTRAEAAAMMARFHQKYTL